MKYLPTHVSRLAYNPTFLTITIVLLTIPAFLINLGVEPLIDDEGIRGLVSLEMIIRHNFLIPTEGGELYFNKPPLYNWILILFFKLLGSYSDSVLRIPTVVFLYLYSASIFLIIRNIYGNRIGFLSALVFLTCGRVLFYDSFKGLIDMSFSWLVYLSFFSIYYFSKKEKYLQMFLIAYLLTALGFLLKGIPAIAFLGITLLTWFIAEKKWKKLFSWQHVVGLLLFFIVLVAYYYNYYLKNPDYFLTLVKTIFNESTKKTIIGTGISRGIVHLFTFPFEFFYHFFPWTIFVIYLFQKEAARAIWNEPFLRFSIITFLSNIVVYWISPATYARYLFMFLPLAFVPLIFLHLREEVRQTALYKFVNVTFIVMFAIVLIGSTLVPVVNVTRIVPWAALKGSGLFVSVALILYLYLKNRKFRFEYMIILLLVARVGFDWFIIPSRYNGSLQPMVKGEVKHINAVVGNDNLYYDLAFPKFKTPEMYYLLVQKQSLICYDTLYNKKGYYLVYDTSKISNLKYKKLGKLHTRKGGAVYSLVKFE